MRARDVPASASCARVTTPCCREVMSRSSCPVESRSRERSETPDDGVRQITARRRMTGSKRTVRLGSRAFRAWQTL